MKLICKLKEMLFIYETPLYYASWEVILEPVNIMIMQLLKTDLQGQEWQPQALAVVWHSSQFPLTETHLMRCHGRYITECYSPDQR